MHSGRDPLVIVCFRRDLRLSDNTALNAALESGLPVLPVYIFDETTLRTLPPDDGRLNFIYALLAGMDRDLKKQGSSLRVCRGRSEAVWEKLLREYPCNAVYMNRDYDPGAVDTEDALGQRLRKRNIAFHTFRDRVIVEGDEVVKRDGMPYTVFTPYKRAWLEKFRETDPETGNGGTGRFYRCAFPFPGREELGIRASGVRVRDYTLEHLDRYARDRDIPAADAGSYLGPHLRFGSVSIRRIVRSLNTKHEVFLSELIWREFFMQILLHYPRVLHANFREKYNGIAWRNNDNEFERWCKGETGYPLVDAGMRQLNRTGYMHNRVRMVAASFLCKDLLTDWRRGEEYFSRKLLDYEPASNNGNWQWAAGTGCDAAPFFRIFNPVTQQKRFDKALRYVRTWIPGYEEGRYLNPVVEHRAARERALSAYKAGMKHR